MKEAGREAGREGGREGGGREEGRKEERKKKKVYTRDTFFFPFLPSLPLFSVETIQREQIQICPEESFSK
jgi:hypothetical protein